MSDGHGRDDLKFLSDRENQQSKSIKKNSGAEEFAQAIARIAVAQVCESLGFQSFQQSALDSLADVGVRYIREIGKAANLYANLANRSECNAFDVIQGLEDLGFTQGFSGASDVNHSLSISGVIKDIVSYVGQSDEIRFAYLTPVFPVLKERTLNPSFSQAEENPPDEHIPSWLPIFPDPKTYTYLSSGSEMDLETEAVEKIQPVDENHRKVQRPVLNFLQKLVRNGFESSVEDHREASWSHRADESNPFLATPLKYGEKEVSVPLLPSKFINDTADYHNRTEAFENYLTSSDPTARPNAIVGSGSGEPENREEEVLVNGRPGIRFKFGNSKKSLRMMTDPQNESSKEVSVWFGDEDEGSKMMKRRADEIVWRDTEMGHL
ncbi:transcription initiation factor TFIID subunit 8 [Striga asiatica]|uniref:Transcription initiation factor TFIID subunit 8 n=1 Tax=Striga asiatica TaxID=4170 RepID=A0A5A7PEE6_STRAF|nr:transcription initiation factor TFIID subunit 8 [Striga asiatica]